MTPAWIFLELFIGGVFLTAGDVVFKAEIRSMSWGVYAFGMALYLVGLIFLVRTYQYENIAVASALLVVFNIITLVIISWFWFKEPVSALEALGIVFAVGAIILLHP